MKLKLLPNLPKKSNVESVPAPPAKQAIKVLLKQQYDEADKFISTEVPLNREACKQAVQKLEENAKIIKSTLPPI